jgi:adenylate cyclase
MVEERVQRRLMAILAADVAGYSRLMGEDEEGTLATLTAHLKEYINPCIAEHRGRIVKTTGDGLLAEFASVVDAVRCAVAFQEGMQDRNVDIPEDRRIAFRIGVNLGDVIVQDDDVFGDGVNVAARLEGLATPDGIVVSGMVHEAVRSKLDVEFDDLGPRTVKNIAEPVHAFSIQKTLGGPAPDGTNEAMHPSLPDKPSIAVLPFENMSSDPEQDYFSDGISEDIITDLSKIPNLLVIARNSTFVYKGSHVSLRDVGRELGVRYVLEGSVRKAGDRVRITAQLIDATDDSHVWADRYDGALDDIFSLQDLVTGEIVTALELQLHSSDSAVLNHRIAPSVEAYDHLLRARQYIFRFTREANAAAQAEVEYALAIDPEYAVAISLMAD